MKKTIVLLLTLTFLTATFAASYKLVNVFPNKFAEESFPYHQISMKYEKGWNIIPLNTLFYSIYDGEAYNDYDAVQQWRKSWKYMYLPKENSYIGMKDNGVAGQQLVGVDSPEELQEKYVENYGTNARLAGQWAYFTEPVVLNYYTPPENNFKSGKWKPTYEKGWHFIVIPIELSEGDLSMGDCSFDRIYRWDSEAQSWDKMSELNMKKKIGQGFIVHTKNDCTLGGAAQPNAPPALPR